jgi:endonuclease/exonuclease/phosphatase (EEP) superfamily protein YafD
MPMIRVLRRFLQLMIGAAGISYGLSLTFHLMLRAMVAPGTVWWVDFANSFTPYLFLPLLLLLPLALLARTSRRYVALPLAGLLLVGLVWLLPRLIPDSASAQGEGTTLAIATFNMRGGSNNQDIGDDIAWLRVQALDIAFIQEIPRKYYDTVAAELTDLYPQQISQLHDLRVRGQSILTPFSVIASEDFFLDERGEAQQRIVIGIDGREVALYNLHLMLPVGNEAHLPWSPSNALLSLLTRYDEQGRNREIDALIERLAAEPLPYIAAGDFNTSDNSVAYERLAAHMTDAFRSAGTGMGGTWPITATIALPDSIPPLLRIDYIWHSRHFRALAAEVGTPVNTYGDHLPVFATLELLPAA